MTGRNGLNKINGLKYNKKKFIYSAKNYKNPFFQTKNALHAERGKIRKNFYVIAAAAAVFFTIAWLLFFSNLFKIKSVEIIGASGQKRDEIKSMAENIAEERLFGKNNLLLYNTTELKKQLNEKFYLDGLKIKRKLFHRLQISFREREQTAVWREGEKYYYIDSAGNITSQADPLNISGKKYPIIENLTGVATDGWKAAISGEAETYILNLFNQFKDNNFHFEIERFIIDKDIDAVKMAVLGGPKIYFSAKEPLSEQTEKLFAIIKNAPDNDIKSIKEYIDLRYANNVYIK